MIKQVAAQAYRTFSQLQGTSELLFQQNLTKLQDLVSHITAHDVALDESLVCRRNPHNPASGEAPVTYIDIWRDEYFSMSMFVLKPGTRLPLHDHPGMYGLIRVLHGQMLVRSYNVIDEIQSDQPLRNLVSRKSLRTRERSSKLGRLFKAKLLSGSASGDCVDVNSHPLLLTPTVGNIHDIHAVSEPVAFLDIIAPPYDEHEQDFGEHPCNYYQDTTATYVSSFPADVGLSLGDLRHLVCIPPPDDYWTDYSPYNGSTFDPYDKNIIV